jgi:hypothetical protein
MRIDVWCCVAKAVDVEVIVVQAPSSLLLCKPQL